MASFQFNHLFTPFTVGPMTVKNRIVVPGHATNLMPMDGMPTDRIFHYWLAKAKGGVGMIITHIHNVMPHQGAAPPTALETEEGIASYLKMADGLHREGAKFLLQISHMGGYTNSQLHGGAIMGPSAGPSKVISKLLPAAVETAHEMEIEDIKNVVNAFRDASARARRAGFDGVEIQGAAYFIVAQFMSPAMNRRKDEYGGSLDNRLRFAREVIQAAREGVGDGGVVGIRLNGDEFSDDGLKLADMLEIAPRLEATGQLDFIDVMAGPGSAALAPPSYYKPGSLVYLTEALRKVVSLPLICSQRITSPMMAEQVLASGAADLIAMNRPIMADPDMPNKAREGRLAEIRGCIACNECIGRLNAGMPLACTVNAEMGREQEMAPRAADTPKKVVVIGGGPAGLEAAKVAALRGHRVTLFEKGEQLGGQSLIASRAPGREDLDEVRRYYTHQMQLLGVDVRLGTEATVETIQREAPDEVVVATGSQPAEPGLSTAGVPVVDPRAVLSEDVEVKPSQRAVVLAGEHHMQALTTADFLADKGCQVQVLTEALYAGALLEANLVELLYRRLLNKGVVITPLTTVKLIDGRTVVTENVLTKQEGTIAEVDLVVAAYGGAADDALYHSLKGQAGGLHLIGDALAPRRLMDAILDGARAGRSL